MSRIWAIVLPALWIARSVSAQEECGLIPLETGTVYACSSGAGPVTVVLAAGAGQSSRTWASLRTSLATSARVVTFDRPGLGHSLPGVLPRTPTQITHELRTVLQALDLPGPLVLVGHSMGGVHMLRYAALFPEAVIGVAILDTPPAGFEERRLTLLTPEERDERQRVLRRGLVDAPETVRLEREGAQISAEWDFYAFPDTLPLVVVVADSQDFGTPGNQAAHRQLWVDESRAWLSLSTEARLMIAEGSGHMVHHDRPDIVVSVVRALTAPSEEE